ncbi:MAG TPA: GNAT family N-acetyltransferase [Solirubrobacteraceae bacterium]
MPLEIRPSRAGDGEPLARVHERCWCISYAGIADPAWIVDRPFDDRVAEWERYAMGGGAPMWVADDDGAVIGEVAAGASRDAEAPEWTGELLAIYVDPDRQGAGVGSALLERAVAELRRAGHQRATLWTFGNNPRATAFYERHGWRADGTVRAEQRFGSPEVRYAREL